MMASIYYVRPRDQWCDPVDGSEPFVTKADYDEADFLNSVLSEKNNELEIEHGKRCLRIRELEDALRGLLDTILVDGCRYGNSKQRMAQMTAQELLTPLETKGVIHKANCPVGGNFACTCGATSDRGKEHG